MNAEGIVTNHSRDLIGIKTSRVDHVLGLHGLLACVNGINTVGIFDLVYLKVANELCAVIHGIAKSRIAKAEGADDRARGCPECAGDLICHVWFKCQYAVAIQYLKTLNAVFHTALVKLLQSSLVLVGIAKHQRAVADILYAKVCAHLLHHLGALHVKARLERSGLCVKACVHDSTVGTGRTHANVIGSLNDTDIKCICRQRTRAKRAYNACSYYTYVKH